MVDCRHRIRVKLLDPVVPIGNNIGFFVLAIYWNACSDLGTRDSYSLCNSVSQA